MRYQCEICGTHIASTEPETFRNSWRDQVRWLYTIQQDYYNERKDEWLDVHLTEVTSIEFGRNVCGPRSNPDQALELMDEPPGTWAVPFHSACWTILEDCFKKEPVPLNRLFRLCASSKRLHTMLLNKDFLQIARDSWNAALRTSAPSDTLEALVHGPRDTIWVLKMLEDTNVTKPAVNPTINPISQRSREDCFSALPNEVLTEIITFLPTTTTMLLRLSSRAFAAQGLQHAFWISRFAEGHELEHMNYLMPKFSSSAMQLYFGLRKTKRVEAEFQRVMWKTMKELKRLLHVDIPQRQGKLIQKLEEMWFTPARHLILPIRHGPWVCRGSRRMQTREIHVPKNFTHLFISFISVKDIDHITGLRFVSATNESSIGVTHMQERMLKVSSNSSVLGLDLALVIDGIAAIAIVHEDQSRTAWSGDYPSEALVMRLVTKNSDVIRLAADFDALKMKSLAILQSEKAKNSKDNLPWWPDLPNKHQLVSKIQYQPGEFGQQSFGMIMFGGENGELLSKLSKIQVRDHPMGDTLSNMEFTYQDNNKRWARCYHLLLPGSIDFWEVEIPQDNDGEPHLKHNTGRGGPPYADLIVPHTLGSKTPVPENAHTCNSVKGLLTNGSRLVKEFRIDGAGGERICFVGRTERWTRHMFGMIVIRTTYGRSFVYSAPALRRGNEWGRRFDEGHGKDNLIQEVSFDGDTIIGFATSIFDSSVGHELGMVSVKGKV